MGERKRTGAGSPGRRRRPGRARGNGRPVIGINCHLNPKTGRYELRQNYTTAVMDAGGIPVLMPFVRTAGEAASVLAGLDGVIFTGGDDIDPRLWRERKHPRATIIPRVKQEADLLLARRAMRRDMPILGICYGMQLLNVASGGSVHQHMPDLGRVVPAHKSSKGNHGIEVAPSRLRKLLGFRQGRVNSFHHQAVNRLARGFERTAAAGDGVIEGLESARHRFLLGVQWHPERMLKRRDQRRLFEALVRAAR